MLVAVRSLAFRSHALILVMVKISLFQISCYTTITAPDSFGRGRFADISAPSPLVSASEGWKMYLVLYWNRFSEDAAVAL